MGVADRAGRKERSCWRDGVLADRDDQSDRSVARCPGLTSMTGIGGTLYRAVSGKK